LETFSCYDRYASFNDGDERVANGENMRFELSDDQVKKIEVWRAECAKKSVEIQMADPPKGVSMDILKCSWESGYAYGGAIGGSTTFLFTPTSLGVVVKVRDSFTGEEIDVTDYEDW
jgi:hypothetical protein